MSDNQHAMQRKTGAARFTTYDSNEPIKIVVPRYYGRALSAVVIAALIILVAHSMITNDNFAWPTVGKYFFSSSVLVGLWTTCWLTLVIMVLAIVLGVIIAVMRLSPNPILVWAANAWIWFFRGTPVLVQLIFWYNLAALYPTVTLGVPGMTPFWQGSMNDLITPWTAAILGLGLNESAYMAEIIRAGISSVDDGQQEAARALGMNHKQYLKRIILPQATPFIIPPTGNQIIGMLKTTSLVSVISLSDLLYSVQSIYSRTYENIPLLIVACIWYLIVTTVLTMAQEHLEKIYRNGRKKSS